MSYSLLEIIGTCIGLLYLWLEYRVSIYLWLAGVIMPAIYAVICYQVGLYADFGVNVYYLLISVYGFLCWLGRGLGPQSEKKMLPVSRLSKNWRMPLIGVGGLLWLCIAGILIHFTDSTVPWMDAFTTAFSIVAMWMLARKYAEQWLVWLLVDVVSVFLYLYKDLYFTAILYGLYAVIAYFGYLKWKKLAE